MTAAAPALACTINGDAYSIDPTGERLAFDGTSVTRGIVPCEIPEFAPYRVESQSLQAVTGCVGPTVAIEVVGRTFQRKNGEYCVRVLVTWIRDGEENTETRCYMTTRTRQYLGN